MSIASTIPLEFVDKPKAYPEDLLDEEVKRRFLALLGPFEEPSVPLNLRVTNEIELDGGIIQQRVEYSVNPNEVVPAFHLFCKNLTKEAPGLLSIHAHGGEDIFPQGKTSTCRPDSHDPNQYSYRAALAGFRVLAPDTLGFGERQTRWGYSSNFWDEIVTQAELIARGRSLAWKTVWDNSLAIEALQYLGASVIGSLGHSGGSMQNYLLASINPKIQAAACFFSFMTLRHQFYQYRLVHCLYLYLSGMIQAGIDWDQVVALTAPRKLFFGWGAKDEGTPEPMYREFVAAIQERCRQKGFPPSVVVHEELEKGHEITEGMLVAALEFLKENLR